MRLPPFSTSALVAATLWLAAATSGDAQDNAKPKGGNERTTESEIARYCSNIAPSAAEARLNYQITTLTAIDARVREALDALDKREQETRDWVIKRQDLMKAATEDMVAIYSKMSAEAAAAQLDDMSETVAASLLSKLKPQAAAAILNEMDPERASHLMSMMAGGSLGADKS